MKKLLMTLALALVLAAVPVLAQNDDQAGSDSTADGGQTQQGDDGASGPADEDPAGGGDVPEPAPL